MTITALEEVVDAEIVRTADEWAEILAQDVERTAEAAVTLGRHLMQAKADVAHGEWLPMIDRAGINEDTAGYMMRIARNGALANSGNYRNLPVATAALYQLSRLDPGDIERGIESGDVHPGMTIKDAKGYVAEVADRSAPANVNTETGEIDPELEAPATDMEKEAAFVNDMRLYILHVGNSKETQALAPASKQYLIAYLREAAKNIEETL